MTNIANVLLVEDDPAARQMLAAILADMGYAVTSAASGDEALSYIYSEEVCDVVLTDIVMPGMSGIEFAQRTREARPGLPLVFVTGQADAEQSAVEAGAIALPKPVTRERLARILADLLDA